MAENAERRGGGRLRRLLLWGLPLLGLLAGLAYLYATATETEEAPQVVSVPVQVGDVEVTVLATGLLKPSRLVAVGAQVSGRVTQVHVALGQTVMEGELIAEIDSLPQQNALRTAEAELASTRASRAELEATLAYDRAAVARQRRTLAQRATSQDEYDAAVAEMKATEAQIDATDADIEAAEVAVETAKIDLDYTYITAPIGGTVLAIVTQEGQTVNAAQSAPTIVILGQLDVMTVYAEISEADVMRVRPGQAVYFNVIGDPDTRYSATLESIEPAPESITSDSAVTTSSSSSSSSTTTEAIYYNGLFDVPNPEGRLRTYMTAEVSIVLGQAQGVLTVPAAALGGRDAEGRYQVGVLASDGAVEIRWVEVGLSDRVTAEVRSGLSEGERVVVGGLSGESAARTPGRFRPPLL